MFMYIVLHEYSRTKVLLSAVGKRGHSKLTSDNLGKLVLELSQMYAWNKGNFRENYYTVIHTYCHTLLFIINCVYACV